MKTETLLPMHGVPRSQYPRTRLFSEGIDAALPDPDHRPELEMFWGRGECLLHFSNGTTVGIDADRLTDSAHVRFKVANDGGPCLPWMSEGAWLGVVYALLIEEADAEDALRLVVAQDFRRRLDALLAKYL